MNDTSTNNPIPSLDKPIEPSLVTGDNTESPQVTAFEHTEKTKDWSIGGGVYEEGKSSSSDQIKAASDRDIENLATKLGVSARSLERLEVAVCNQGWVFPMRDATGEIVGHRLRRWDGTKQTLTGGQNGLFIPIQNVPAMSLYVTEGESDLAAALDLGLPAIGRPGAMGCIDEIVDYLVDVKFNAITIIADCDSNGAGEAGAEELANALLLNGHIVRVVLPPESFKDLREAVRNGLTSKSFEEHTNKYSWRAPAGTPPGFFAIGNWHIRRGLMGEIGLNAFGVLSAILSVRDSAGLCRIGRQRIAEAIGRSVSTVDKALAILKKNGLLEVVKRGHEGWENTYRVHLGPFNPQRKRG